MTKEFHWYENIEDMNSEANICLGYYATGIAFARKQPIICSDQIFFFSTRTISQGYKLFIHFANGTVTEVKLGENSCTNREIREGHNLSKMLLAGEFGELSI